jgi:hypothetical protein
VSLSFTTRDRAWQVARFLTQDLPRLRVAGKVTAVMWTRRDDAFTLQVVLELPTEFKIASKIAADRAAGRQVVPPSPPLPRVQAWVLRADGTAISRFRNPLPGKRQRWRQ